MSETYTVYNRPATIEKELAAHAIIRFTDNGTQAFIEQSQIRNTE